MKVIVFILFQTGIVLSVVLRAGIFAIPLERGLLNDKLGYAVAILVDRELDEIDLVFSRTYPDLDSAVHDLVEGRIDVLFGAPKIDAPVIHSKHPVYAVRFVNFRKCPEENEEFGWTFGNLSELPGILSRNDYNVTVDGIVADWIVENFGLEPLSIFGKEYRYILFSTDVPENVVEAVDFGVKRLWNEIENLIGTLVKDGFVLPPGKLTLANSSYPPFEFFDGEKWRGIDVEIVEEVFRRMGYEIEILEMPWKRVLESIRSKTIDGTFTLEMTRERKKYMVFTREPLGLGRDVFFYMKNEEPDWNHPGTIRVGYIPGYSYEDFLKRTGFDLVPVKNEEMGIVMLERGRIDALMTDLLVGLHYAKRLNVEVKWTEPIRVYKTYIALSKLDAHEVIALEISRVLRVFKRSEKYREIFEKYGLKGMW